MGRFSITLGEYEENIVKEYIKSNANIKINTGVNELILRGINKYDNDNGDSIIRNIVKEQIAITIKPHTESLATFSSKVAHMSGRTVFLLVQLAVDTFGLNNESHAKIKELHKSASVLAQSGLKNK